MAKKVMVVNGLVIAEHNARERADGFDWYGVYLKEEWVMASGYRNVEMECGTLETAKAFAADYYTEVD